jgi:hypothetical protein
MLHLYGRSQGEPAPGRWIKTVVSDGDGYFNFYIIEPYIYDIMRLVAESPDGMTATGAWSDNGKVISPTEIEWVIPAPAIHRSKFFFDIATPTPTPTATPSPTPVHTIVQDLRATWANCGVMVAWSTTHELTDAKLQIQRSTSSGGPFSNALPIIDGQGAPANYAVCDDGVIPGHIYYYRLHIFPEDAYTTAVASQGSRQPLFMPIIWR